MQFALLIYHSPEEFAMRENDSTILISPLGGLTPRRSSRPACMSAAVLLKCPRRDRPYGLGRESAACRMGPMRRRRSNWEDSSSWKSLPLTPRSNGLRDAQAHRSARWKSGRWRPKRCAGDSQVNEGSRENVQSSVGRIVERVARESYGRLVAYLSVHTHDVASAEDALSDALVASLRTPRPG